MVSTMKAAKKTTAKASRLKQDRDASAILPDLDKATEQHPMDMGAAFRCPVCETADGQIDGRLGSVSGSGRKCGVSI